MIWREPANPVGDRCFCVVHTFGYNAKNSVAFRINLVTTF